MKLIIKSIIFLLFIGNLAFSQNTVTELTSISKITFPVESELTETSRNKVFTANDEFAVYMVILSELSEQQISLIERDGLLNFYHGVANGSINAAEGKLISMEKVNLENSFALEIEYSANSNPNLPIQRFKRIFFFNNTLYNIDFWPTTENEEIIKNNKSNFFNSFSISSEIINQNKSKNIEKTPEFNAGFLVGQVVFFLFLIAFLIGVVFLIRYLIKKNENKNSTSHQIVRPQAKSAKKICKKCESENNPDTKYCTRCGFELPKN